MVPTAAIYSCTLQYFEAMFWFKPGIATPIVQLNIKDGLYFILYMEIEAWNYIFQQILEFSYEDREILKRDFYK